MYTIGFAYTTGLICIYKASLTLSHTSETRQEHGPSRGDADITRCVCTRLAQVAEHSSGTDNTAAPNDPSAAADVSESVVGCNARVAAER